jgi:hypothetical protein
MAWSEALQAYTYQCPCGDLFQITLQVRAPACVCVCVCVGGWVGVCVCCPGAHARVRVRAHCVVPRASVACAQQQLSGGATRRQLGWRWRPGRAQAQGRLCSTPPGTPARALLHTPLAADARTRVRRHATGAAGWRGDRALPQLLAVHHGRVRPRRLCSCGPVGSAARHWQRQGGARGVRLQLHADACVMCGERLQLRALPAAECATPKG